MEGLGHNADGEDSHLARDAADNRRGTSAGTAAHASCDEAHMGAVQRLGDVLDRFLGGTFTDLGFRACAQTARHAGAHLNGTGSERTGKRLGIRVRGDEIDALKMLLGSCC